MARWLLRISVTASVLLIVAHFAYAFNTYRQLTLESVQFAELGLPLLFAAFLNGAVWSSGDVPVIARWATHLANVIMIAMAVLVARFAPLAPAYLVLGCAVALGMSGVAAELSGESAAVTGAEVRAA